jgi:cell division protein FtsW
MKNESNIKTLFASLKGDKTIWAVVALIAVFTFIPVYTASSNLAYLNGGNGSTFTYLIKHFGLVFIGFLLMYATHKIPYRYFSGLSAILLPFVIILLIFTLLQGHTAGGANASRWIQVPIVGMGFQTSTFAAVVLLVYVARYLAKIKDKSVTFKQSLFPLWLPVFLVIGLIFPANFSTAALLFSLTMLLCFLGGYPIKYISIVVGTALVFALLFGLTAKAFPDLFPNRVDTWVNRVENFSDGEDAEEQYQVQKAKIAIASGGITGKGIGKSVQRNFLPQSSSDFIYAIIIEEMGLIGGFGVIICYLIILGRIAIMVTKSQNEFAQLLVIAVGLPFVFQAFINMGVAVQVFPVTGQTLPLISSGGTSIWMTCISIGILQSVKANRDEEELKKRFQELGDDAENPLEIMSEAI